MDTQRIQERLIKDLEFVSRQATAEDRVAFEVDKSTNSMARLHATGVRQLTRSALHNLLIEHQDRWKKDDGPGCILTVLTAGLASLYYKLYYLDQKWAHPSIEQVDAALDSLAQQGAVALRPIVEEIPDDAPENFEPKVLDTMVTLVEVK